MFFSVCGFQYNHSYELHFPDSSDCSKYLEGHKGSDRSTLWKSWQYDNKQVFVLYWLHSGNLVTSNFIHIHTQPLLQEQQLANAITSDTMSRHCKRLHSFKKEYISGEALKYHFLYYKIIPVYVQLWSRTPLADAWKKKKQSKVNQHLLRKKQPLRGKITSLPQGDW